LNNACYWNTVSFVVASFFRNFSSGSRSSKTDPAGELLAKTEQTLRGILAMGPLAVRLAIEAVDQGLEMTLDEGLLLEANHFGLLAATQDMREGLTAFLEKRPARFRGR